MNQLICLGLITALGMSAVETRTWRQTDYSEFEKGSLKRLSLRSDGRLTLAPLVKAEKVAWGSIGENPSALKTNYVIAYLSAAAGQNLGQRFKDDWPRAPTLPSCARSAPVVRCVSTASAT